MTDMSMNPQETLKHIKELCDDAGKFPQFLTFQLIAEWCNKQMKSWDDSRQTRPEQCICTPFATNIDPNCKADTHTF